MIIKFVEKLHFIKLYNITNGPVAWNRAEGHPSCCGIPSQILTQFLWVVYLCLAKRIY